MNLPLENLQRIVNEVEGLQKKHPSSAKTITIEAVSKNQPLEKIIILLEHGHRNFAENKVQEAQIHWRELKPKYPDLRLHMIGGLQRNKARQAVALFDVIETIGSIALAESVALEAEKIHKIQDIMVQINIGLEAQKSGVTLDDLPPLIDFCTNNSQLNLLGLMCVPPANQPAAPFFAQMLQLKNQYNLPHLSMGMSGDYAEAVMHGATHIRIGSALFGERVN